MSDKNYNFLFTITICTSLFCHLLLISLIRFSYQNKFMPQHPYFISLGAILHRSEFSLNESDETIHFSQASLSNNLSHPIAPNSISNRIKITKPLYSKEISIQEKTSPKIFFPEKKESSHKNAPADLDDDFNEDFYKPLRLP